MYIDGIFLFAGEQTHKLRVHTLYTHVAFPPFALPSSRLHNFAEKPQRKINNLNHCQRTVIDCDALHKTLSLSLHCWLLKVNDSGWAENANLSESFHPWSVEHQLSLAERKWIYFHRRFSNPAFNVTHDSSRDPDNHLDFLSQMTRTSSKLKLLHGKV